MEVTNDSYTETLVFFHVIKNYDLASVYKPIYFSVDRLKKLFEIIRPYIMEYHEEPSEKQVYILIQRANLQTELTADIIHSLWAIRDHLSQYSEEWLHNTAKGYAEWNNFIVAVNRMHTYMMTTQYEVTPESAHEYVQKVKTMFSGDTNFSICDSVGHDFFDPAEHKQSVVETVSTGYKFFDTCLNGGWAKKTLNVVMGPPKVGKSMWLCNLCANSVLAGENSAYITLEMSYQLVNQRIGSNLLNIPIREYEKYAEDQNVIKNKILNLNNQAFISPGALVVEEFPTSSATVYDIESFLLNAEKNRSKENAPFKFRNVFIDYINIMADAKHSNVSDQTYMKIKSICEDVRAMAQRNEWCVISLTQTNRSGMNASDLDMSSVAESSGLIATVDSLFGIICTTMMKAENVYYIKALALRNSPHMGDKKKYNFQGDYLRIKEDETEDIIPDTIPLPENLTVGANDNTGNNNYHGYAHSRHTEPQPQPIQQQTHTPPPAPILGDNSPNMGTVELVTNSFDLFNA